MRREQIVTLEFLPNATQDEIAGGKPMPFPGSDEAIAEGCTCPRKQIWPRGLVISTVCPIMRHQFKHAKPN